MMEGFKRHEGQTGQNPFDMAKQQNDQIKRTIEEAVGPENMGEFQKRLAPSDLLKAPPITAWPRGHREDPCTDSGN